MKKSHLFVICLFVAAVSVAVVLQQTSPADSSQRKAVKLTVESSCDCAVEHMDVSKSAERVKVDTQSVERLLKEARGLQEWISKAEGGKTVSETNLRKGIELAKNRRTAMLELIKVDPEQALVNALTWAEYKLLPEQIKPFVETPFSGRGDFQVMPNCGGGGEHINGQRKVGDDHLVKLGRQEYRSSVFGRRKWIDTKENTPLQGIYLDGWSVVRSAPLQKLSAADHEAIQSDFPKANKDITHSFFSGQKIAGAPVVALGGGKLFYFSSEDELRRTNEKLEELDELPGPHSGAQVIFLQASGADGDSVNNDTQGLNWEILENTAQLQASSWTETKKKVFFIRVDFSDNTGESTSQATLANVLNTTTSDTIKDMSYGKTWIEADVSSMVVRLPSPTTTYLPSDNTQLRDDAIAAFNAIVPATGINLGDYDIVGVHFKSIGMQSSGGLTYAGLAGGSRQWLQGTTNSGVIIHEFGHNYGLGHARYWDTGGASVVGSGSTVEYGNKFDIMGSGPDPEGHFHPQAKAKINWLEATQWVDTSVGGSATHRVYRSDHKDTSGVRGLRVPKDSGIDHYYWVGYRRSIISNEYLQGGVVLNWEKSGTSWLIDTTPGSPEGKDDSGVLIGQTYSDSTAGIHVTPVAQGGVSPNEWVDVTVNIGAFAGNNVPTATLSGPSTGDARTPLMFSVSANDGDGDTLAYSWDFGDGAVINNQNTATHTWDLGGTYNVEVTITDMKGGTVSKSLTVTVNDPLNNWTVGNVGSAATMSEASYINGRYILTGNQYAYFSLDGLSWTRSYLTLNYRAGGIIYGGDKYVITGQDWNGSDWRAIAFYSNDGKNWSKSTVPDMEYMYDVAYGNGRFVAVGNDGGNMYSTDGVTWLAGTTVGSQDLDAVSFANGEFVAVGDDAVHASSDGLTWVDRSSSTGLSSWHSLKDVLHADGKFFAGGWYSGIRYSSDNGVTWQAATMPSGISYDIKAIHVAAGVYAAVAERQSDNAAVLLVSSDGLSWKEGIPANFVLTNTLTYGNGAFFATQGSAGATQYSDTFFSSNLVPTATISGDATVDAREVVQYTASSSDADGDDLIHIWDFQDGTDLVTGDSAYHSFPTGGTYTVKLTVVDGRGGLVTDTLVVTVTDPLSNWPQRTSGTTADLYDITVGGGKLVAVGGSSGNRGAYRVSTDATTWTGGALGGNIRLNGVIYDGTNFVAAGYDYDFAIPAWVGVVYTSPDGSSWTRRHFGGEELRDVAYDSGAYVACGDGGTLLRSTDALTWSTVTSGVSHTLRGVSSGAGVFVVVGSSGTVLTSDEGIIWSDESASSGTGSSFYDVQYLNDRFLASGNSAKIRYSTDGGNSFSVHETHNYRIPGFAYGNGIYLASGWDTDNSDSDIDLVSEDGVRWAAMTTVDREESNAAVFFQNTFITVGAGGEIRQSDAFTAPSGWDIWRANQFPNHPPLSGPYDDFDGDGVANLMEYITGTNAKLQGSYVTPTISEESGYLTLTVNKAAGVSGFSMFIESSVDLIGWDTVGLVVVTDDSSMLKVRLDTLTVDPSIVQKFLRANASVSP